MAQNYTPIDDIVEKNKTSYVSSASRESEPALMKDEVGNIQEVVEHEPEEEVKPFLGIRAESIQLPPDLKKLGVQASSSSKFQSYTNIKLPISDDKIVSGLHAPINSSLRWLATLAFHLLKKAHLSLKKIHGKIVRVVAG